MTKNKQIGSHHIAILVIITIALIGAIGFIFWKNIVNKDQSSSPTGAPVTQTRKTTTPTPQSTHATKHFDGQTGFQWGTFDYPSDWAVDSDIDVAGTAPNVGPGIIVKSPDFKIEGQGTVGSYINISVTKNWKASTAYWESQQQAADQQSTFGHFTFHSKPAVIWRGTTAQDTTRPAVATLADMYKGESTWVQGDGIIYTFAAYTNGQPADTSSYEAIKTVLDSWTWK